jgi:SAM-dependent methyltransferase
MGLLIPVVEFILEENAHRPITGEALFIGKQQTYGRELAGNGVTIHYMDQSDYEGAEIIWDLGNPVPTHWDETYDFIYDGGSLDNMFNPAQAMMNFTRMLKPDGRMVCMAAASSFPDPYLMFSPGWFNDYYEFNRFKSWTVYVCMYRSKQQLLYGPWERYRYGIEKDKNGSPPPAEMNRDWLVLTIAEKGPDTTSDVQPIQYQYRR